MNDRSIHCKLSNRRYRALDHVGIDSPEPFTPSVRAFRAHPSIPGSFVVIIGLGLFGLYILQAARASGAGTIIVLGSGILQGVGMQQPYCIPFPRAREANTPRQFKTERLRKGSLSP